MVEIFTDASVKGYCTVSTCFCLDTFNFIGHRIFSNKRIQSSVIGELFGATEAIKYVIDTYEDLSSADQIILYTDSKALLHILTSDIHITKDGYDKRVYPKLVKEFRSLVAKYSISVQLIEGHQATHNPNKVVDLISGRVLCRTGG